MFNVLFLLSCLPLPKFVQAWGLEHEALENRFQTADGRSQAMVISCPSCAFDDSESTLREQSSKQLVEFLLATAPAARFHASSTAAFQPEDVARAQPVEMFFGGGNKKERPPAPGQRNARPEAPGQRREKQPDVIEVSFPQKGKKTMAKKGEPLGAVARRAGVKINFDCKNGRCGTCQVFLNGRATAKICQGAKVPTGGIRKLDVMLANP